MEIRFALPLCHTADTIHFSETLDATFGLLKLIAHRNPLIGLVIRKERSVRGQDAVAGRKHDQFFDEFAIGSVEVHFVDDLTNASRRPDSLHELVILSHARLLQIKRKFKRRGFRIHFALDADRHIARSRITSRYDQLFPLKQVREFSRVKPIHQIGGDKSILRL